MAGSARNIAAAEPLGREDHSCGRRAITDVKTTAYDEGVIAGRDLGKVVADCPYPMVDAGDQRKQWLDGFGAARPTVSPASDPAHAEGRFEASGPSEIQAKHEG